MSDKNSITGWVLIRNGQIIVDGGLVFEMKNAPAADFLSGVYQGMHMEYPKFFKMDNLCKLGFLASEVLLKDKKLKEKYLPEEIGILFSNANSSLDTDMRYKAGSAIAPSPALFVYTLPNIVVGEICIRQSIKGESSCFIFDIFDFAFQADYMNTLLNSERVKSCISGWADFYDGKFEAFFYLVEKSAENERLEHNAENVGKIYQGIWNS